jgi:rhamnose transport system substrate-binding protein
MMKKMFEGVLPLAIALLSAPAFGADIPYNGGQPINAKDLKGKKIVLVDVPKLIGIGYFSETAKGIAEGCADQTKNGAPTEVTTEAPADDDITKQVQFIDNQLISRGVDGIFVAAIDPVAISPVLRKALRNGIHVIGYDIESQPNDREWFLQKAAPEGVAKALIDSLVAEVGPVADIALVTSADKPRLPTEPINTVTGLEASSLTSADQSAWISEIKKYIGVSCPKLNLVTILPVEEDRQVVFKVVGQSLKAYPQLKGIIGLSSEAFSGAADAITQAKLGGKVAVVGVSTPNEMKPFVKSGVVKSVILWNPVDLGYASAYAMRASVDGMLKPGATELDAGRLGKLKVINGSQILLGPPTVFTKDNIDKYDF